MGNAQHMPKTKRKFSLDVNRLLLVPILGLFIVQGIVLFRHSNEQGTLAASLALSAQIISDQLELISQQAERIDYLESAKSFAKE